MVAQMVWPFLMPPASCLKELKTTATTYQSYDFHTVGCVVNECRSKTVTNFFCEQKC